MCFLLVKLLQMIWGRVTSFMVYQSVRRFVCIFERHTFHIIMASFQWDLELQSLGEAGIRGEV